MNLAMNVPITSLGRPEANAEHRHERDVIGPGDIPAPGNFLRLAAGPQARNRSGSDADIQLGAALMVFR